MDPPEQIVETPTEVILPQVLEEVLALKNQRALELEVEETDPLQAQTREVLWEKDDNVVCSTNGEIVLLCC